ncbi:MAG: hypothetical protein ACTSXQ_00460 [Alphaproteobacteria bacterium]
MKKLDDNKKKTSLVNFQKEENQYDKGYRAGMAQGMYSATEYALSLVQKNKHNHWHFLSVKINGFSHGNENNETP